MLKERLFIGTSGYHYPHWRDYFYPKDLDESQFLEFYAQRLSTVEMPYSFYHLPNEATVSKWMKAACHSERSPRSEESLRQPGLTQNRFAFSLLAYRGITHIKQLRDVESDLEDFYLRIPNLGEWLGPILFQLPRSLHKDLSLLKSFLSLLEPSIKHAVEFRHDSWLDDEVMDSLREFGVACCLDSAPRLDCRFDVTAPFVYIRLHGIHRWYVERFTDEDLLPWADRIRGFFAQGLSVYVYFTNAEFAHSAHNALRLERMLLEP